MRGMENPPHGFQGSDRETDSSPRDTLQHPEYTVKLLKCVILSCTSPFGGPFRVRTGNNSHNYDGNGSSNKHMNIQLV